VSPTLHFYFHVPNDFLFPWSGREESRRAVKYFISSKCHSYEKKREGTKKGGQNKKEEGKRDKWIDKEKGRG
jgi:hypothetical protein